MRLVWVVGEHPSYRTPKERGESSAELAEVDGFGGKAPPHRERYHHGILGKCKRGVYAVSSIPSTAWLVTYAVADAVAEAFATVVVVRGAAGWGKADAIEAVEESGFLITARVTKTIPEGVGALLVQHVAATYACYGQNVTCKWVYKYK